MRAVRQELGNVIWSDGWLLIEHLNDYVSSRSGSSTFVLRNNFPRIKPEMPEIVILEVRKMVRLQQLEKNCVHEYIKVGSASSFPPQFRVTSSVFEFQALHARFSSTIHNKIQLVQ